MVTKPDLMDPGSEGELKAVVSNKRYPLKKGYTVVKCRGQQAIDNGQSLSEAMEEETAFFEHHKTLGCVIFYVYFKVLSC